VANHGVHEGSEHPREGVRYLVDPPEPDEPSPRLVAMLFVSGVFLLVQVTTFRYGSPFGDSRPQQASAVFWFLGAALLWAIYCRSRLAWLVTVGMAAAGAVVYFLEAIVDEQQRLHASLLVVAYLGQLLPLVARSVLSHVGVRHGHPGPETALRQSADAAPAAQGLARGCAEHDPQPERRRGGVFGDPQGDVGALARIQAREPHRSLGAHAADEVRPAHHDGR